MDLPKCDCKIIELYGKRIVELECENAKLHNVIDVVRKYQKWIDIPGFSEALDFLEDN